MTKLIDFALALTIAVFISAIVLMLSAAFLAMGGIISVMTTYTIIGYSIAALAGAILSGLFLSIFTY
jgi:hypothetical protein